jgi:hypothetical protein
MWLIKQPQIILSILEIHFPLSISENVLKYSVTSCLFNIWDVWCNPKETSRASRLLWLIGFCIWKTCTSFCIVNINFLIWWKTVCPVRPYIGHCFEILGEENSELVGTDGTTKLLCSVKPHDIFQIKFTVWAVRTSAYVPFLPLHLSWPPTPFAPLFSCHVASCSILCEVCIKYLYFMSCRDLPPTLVIRL